MLKLSEFHCPSQFLQAVKSKDHGNRRKIVCIFRWLFAKMNLVSPLAKSLASVAMTSQENRVKLGWCVIVRELIEKEALLYLFPSDGEFLKSLNVKSIERITWVWV